MLVALDATYLVDPHPSGISVYSRELLYGLAKEHPNDAYLHYYRLKQFRKAPDAAFANVHKRLFLPLPALGKRPDIFHALNQRVDQRLARRVVSTFHDLFVLTGEYSSMDFRVRFAAQARQAAERSHMIIAVSEFTRQQVIGCLNVEPERVRVVPHGVHPPPTVPELAAREKMILCVGALQLRKNVTRLVQSFERLPPAIRQGWTLVLAGSTAGFGAAEILNHIASSAAANQITLKGYVSAQELSDLYQRALIFAFPSLDEGFGIPVLEAMANGVPVLTSNRSALPQVAGEAALLVDPYNVDDMSVALSNLMADDKMRSKLRTLGLQRAELFPWRNAVESTYSLYRELLI